MNWLVYKTSKFNFQKSFRWMDFRWNWRFDWTRSQNKKVLFLKCSLVSKTRIWTTSINQTPLNLKFAEDKTIRKSLWEATFWLRRTEGFRWSKSQTKKYTFADFILLSKKPKIIEIGSLGSSQLDRDLFMK